MIVLVVQTCVGKDNQVFHRRSGRRPLGHRIAATLVTIAPLIGIVAMLSLWQFGVRTFHVRRFILPAPSEVLRQISREPRFYWDNARVTLYEAALGYSVALLVGTIVAVILARFRFLERAVTPILVLVQVTPLIAYATAIVLWLKFGIRTIVFITAIACSIPFVINVLSGLRSADPHLIELALSVDASEREILFRIRLPSALPSMVAAARVSVGLALIGTVLGEFFAGSTAGLGHEIRLMQTKSSVRLWAATYVLAAVGVVAVVAIGIIERFALHWHDSQQKRSD